MALPMPGTMQRKIYDAAQVGLTAKEGYHKEKGNCAGWCRQVYDKVPGVIHWLAGKSAKQVEALLIAKGAQRIAWKDANVGDMVFWNQPNHGPDGHCGIYFGAGMVAMNTSADDYSDKDARCIRAAKLHGPVSAVYRLWR